MSLIDHAGFTTLVDERYREIEQMELAAQNDMRGTFYDMLTSDRQTERIGSVGEMPQWGEFNGSLAGNYARPYEQYNVLATHLEFAQGMTITRRMFDDDLTNLLRGERFRAMVRSGVVTQQTHAARLFNFADSNDTYFYSRSEGLSLVNDSHTTRTAGVSTASGFDNQVTTALSPTAYRSARIQYRQLRNDQGDFIDEEADMLIVPVDLQPRAEEIINTTSGLDSDFGNVNPEARSARVVGWVRLTDTNNWYIVNEQMMKSQCKWFDRVPIEFESITDFETKQMKRSGYGRWSTAILDWRFILGAIVS